MHEAIDWNIIKVSNKNSIINKYIRKVVRLFVFLVGKLEGP